MIRANAVSYEYPTGALALRDIGAKFDVGKLTALIGPNGSGKSTLAKILAGLIQPTSGTIEIDGRDPSEPPGTVSLAWQNPDNQLVCDIVEDDIAFGPENLGLDIATIEQRVEEIIDRLSLASLRKSSIHQLSAAQKQVIAVAGVMAMSPQYLILDEVTARLDPSAAHRLLVAVRQWSEDHGAGIIMITHHMSEVLVADGVVRLSVDQEGGGRVADAGPASKVLASVPADPDIVELGALDQTLSKLRRLGVTVPDSIGTVDELAENLCR